LSRGEVEEAVAAFQTALMYNPGFPEAQARLAELREGGGRRSDQEETGAGAGRRPGERPAWLKSDRFEELVEAVSGCRSVEGAALINSDGLLLDGILPAPGKVEGGAGAAAELMAGARDLVKRLAAGRLRAAAVSGEGGSLRCVALGNLTLAATLKPGAPVGAAAEEMEEAVHGLGCRGKSGKGVRA
jgi:predicted regulator of Ras-like GTPase activity (Roadblock/LC7/MglB family)